MILKTLKSFQHAWHGIRYAYSHELSFRMEVWSGIILAGIGWYLWPLQEYEFLFLIFSYILVLAFELINTAFERMFERIHPEHHELVGHSKDLASAAVLVAVVFAGIVVLVVGLSHGAL